MKRTLSLAIIGAVAALAILYAVRLSERSSSTKISTLLSHDTIAFVHLPDLNRTRTQWHQSDIYQLYSEPSVQEFLRKPLARLAKKASTTQALQEIEQLDPKDAFIAITRIENNNPTLVGGFRFHANRADAEAIIEKWRSNLLAKNPVAKREKIKHGQREIDLFTVAPFTLATAVAGDWFFAANDLSELETILDRADHPAQDRQSTLEADKNYRAAMAHLASGYAFSFYMQPKFLADRLAALRREDGRNVPPDQRTIIEQMQSICGATRFERGKIHDVFFVGMPKLEDTKLTRSSLTLGTKDTFLYLAMLLNLGQKFDALNQATGAAPITAGWQKILQAFARTGVTAEEWNAAFGAEMGALAEWPATARWPWFLGTFPVQDVGKAGKIVEAITRVDEDSVWKQTEKDGVRYFSMVSPANLFAISPTIALSNKIVIAGIDPISVETAVKRNDAGHSELSNSASYVEAASSIPTPTNMFAYVDVPRLYSRLDTTLRPMLLVSAAFLPWLSDYVDLAKLPTAEIITKHISPIVSSQRYEGDGYVAESMGSITLNQSGAGLVLLGAFGTTVYQRAMAPSPAATATSRPGGAWKGKGYKVPNLPSPSPSSTP
jgi:hypothetical protein